LKPKTNIEHKDSNIWFAKMKVYRQYLRIFARWEAKILERNRAQTIVEKSNCHSYEEKKQPYPLLTFLLTPQIFWKYTYREKITIFFRICTFKVALAGEKSPSHEWIIHVQPNKIALCKINFYPRHQLKIHQNWLMTHKLFT
jgi:hypothetical protein